MRRERGRDRDADRATSKPRPIAEALAELLARTGLDEDVRRSAVLAEWSRLVGPQIAGVTQPRIITEDGTLVVGVRTHAWMNELSLMERALVAKLAAGMPASPVRRIRWELQR